MKAETSPRLCIYCGGPVGRVKKGEHIIPEAIGGARTIKTVCGDCNNGFSRIDAEVCSRSPLSVIASQEIGAHIWQVWDVDHAARNLLLEARPDWSAQSLTQYPQMVFEQSGPQIRGDYLEMLHFGREDSERVFVKSMLRAFRRHEAGEQRWLHAEHIETNPALATGYRFPPRIFFRHSIDEPANRLLSKKRASFVLRYLTPADRRFALNVLDNWNPTGRFRAFGVGIGSHLPALRCFYDAASALRGLLKIAINVLAAYCPNTPVNKDAFPDVVKVVKGEAPVTEVLLLANGFAWACDIQPIKADDRGHSFRLLHTDGQWSVYASFFGGRVGSFVRFAGPNHEPWRCASIVAPLHSQDWVAVTSALVQPLTARIEWQDPAKIMPSVEICNVQTGLKVTPLPTRKA